MVVIAIIALLAGLIVYLLPGVNEKKIRGRARTELHMLEAAINNYKTKLGFYPPDNPNQPGTNALFYELTGTERQNNNGVIEYESLMREYALVSQRITTNNIGAYFSAAGFLNSGEERQNFAPGLKEKSHFTAITSGAPLIHLLTFPYKGPGRSVNPWYYDASNPTHNPDSYDLWIEIDIGGKVVTIGNWND